MAGDARAALLGPPPGQRPRQAAEAAAAQGQAGPARDPLRRESRARRAGHPQLRTGVRGEVPESRRLAAQDQDKLLTFFDLPAEHWQHLRTTNVIESPFATVRLRQRVTKGAGARLKALVMAYKLLDMAQLRWRRLNAPHLLPLVRAGVIFVDGVRQEREEEGVKPR